MSPFRNFMFTDWKLQKSNALKFFCSFSGGQGHPAEAESSQMTLCSEWYKEILWTIVLYK